MTAQRRETASEPPQSVLSDASGDPHGPAVESVSAGHGTDAIPVIQLGEEHPASVRLTNLLSGSETPQGRFETWLVRHWLRGSE